MPHKLSAFQKPTKIMNTYTTTTLNYNHKAGSEAWSIGSVRASGTEGSEFEPTFRHSLLSGGPWQDLVSSVRLEPLTGLFNSKMYGVTNQ